MFGFFVVVVLFFSYDTKRQATKAKLNKRDYIKIEMVIILI